MPEDFYKVLGVDKSSTPDQIKKAYRELALKYHPDRNKEKSAEARFKTINEAYAVLGDPEKRRQYDMMGSAAFNQRFSEEDIFRNFNINDIFKDMGINIDMGGFSFGGMGGFGNQPQEQTGVTLNLSFSDIEKGIDREYQVERVKRCAVCRGTGGDPSAKQSRCQDCDGTGQVHVRQRTPFGVFDAISPCRRCMGKGRIYEKRCSSCGGGGWINVREKFRVRIDGGGQDPDEHQEKRQKKWF